MRCGARWVLAGTLGMLALGARGEAQDMRRFRRIRSPHHKDIEPQGFERFQRLRRGVRQESVAHPVSRAVLDAAVEKLSRAWTTRQLRDMVADSFQQRERFLEAMQLNVPRDVVMQVEATRNVFTLGQEVHEAEDGGRERVSIVSATLHTRLLVNDPQRGFVAVPGTTEVLLELTEPLEDEPEGDTDGPEDQD